MISVESLPIVKDDEIITNYYTGEKWYLVSINGNQTYVNEAKYKQLQGPSEKLIPNIT